jgi:hypothetical protein
MADVSEELSACIIPIGTSLYVEDDSSLEYVAL